ncbi:MAG: hypothetical protein U0165_09235 [Polyangiaceae bacterium]
MPLVSCGSTYVLSQGPMLRSAGLIEALSFRPHPSGILVDLGPSIARHLPLPSVIEPLTSELACPRFDGDMVLEHHRWLEALGVTSVGSFNETCIAGQVSRIIHVAEGFQEKRIARVADEIAYRRGKARVVCIAGPSSSGKTTFLKRLSVQLEINGFRAVTLSLDDYYVDRDATPRDERGELDFERLDALDLSLLRDHVGRLVRGQAVVTARYDFLTGRSNPTGGRMHQLGPTDVLLIEGIHALNPTLFDGAIGNEQLFRIFIHPATTLPLDRFAPVSPSDLRLLRRIVRDRHQRGYRAAVNIARWPSVLRGEALTIYPYMPTADVIFDTSLIYEPAVLKVFAERYLLEVSPDDPTFPVAFRLRRLVDRFVTIYPDHVPPTSILREFIGRGSEGLFASKIRCAFLHPCGDPLHRIAASQALGLSGFLARQRIRIGSVGTGANGLFDVPNRDRRACCNLRRPRDRFFYQRLGGHHSIRNSQSQRIVSGYVVARQEKLHRTSCADQSW